MLSFLALANQFSLQIFSKVSQVRSLNLQTFRQLFLSAQELYTKFVQMKQMNPFQKLKFTIDRIGLDYVPSNDQQTITGQTVYKYTRSQQLQQQDNHVPYFKTQGHNEESFKKHSADFRVQEIEELKAVYQNQQRNLVSQINALNIKLRQFEMRYQVKCQQNERLKQQVDSRMRQNTELRGYIIDLEQKNSRKLSESGVLDRERKLKEQIDRINLTVMDLAKQLNTQKTTRKNLQKQLDSFKLQSHEIETSFNTQRSSLKKEISVLKEQLEKRTELLQHSIKSSRDEKVLHKQEMASIKQKNEIKIDSLRQQMQQLRQQVYSLKNRITQITYLNNNLQKQIQASSKQNLTVQTELTSSQTLTTHLNQKLHTSAQKIQQLRLQVAYYQQQLQEERSNTKVKVVEVRDEGQEMELAMYKKQCKELIKEKNILETVRRDKSDYTIVSENQVVLNRSE